MDLLTSMKTSIAVTVTAGAAGTDDIEGTALDMSGYEGVLMIVTVGAVVSGAATSIKAQQGEASDLSDAADLLGTAQTIADDDDEQIFIIDLYRPRERYVRLFVARATQNATCTAIYVQYGGRKKPTTQGSNVNSETHVSPAQGTA